MPKANGSHLSTTRSYDLDELEAHLGMTNNDELNVVVFHIAEAGRTINRFTSGTHRVSEAKMESADDVIGRIRKLPLERRKQIGRAITESGFWDTEVEAAFEQILPGRNSGLGAIKKIAQDLNRGLSL